MLNPSRKRLTLTSLTWTSILALALTACVQPSPPFNQFQLPSPDLKPILVPTGVGVATGLLVGNAVTGGTLAGGAAIGAAIGGTAGILLSMHHASKRGILTDLQADDIQFVQYGDTMTLVIPTDHYFLPNSATLNETCFKGLNDIIRLLRLYPCHHYYVAAFTDNVGSPRHKQQRSQAQAEAMITFLWANGIPALALKAEGHADHHTIGDDHWIRGSAYNRRIEIQWLNQPRAKSPFNWAHQLMK